jgi:hypothetical protein
VPFLHVFSHKAGLDHNKPKTRSCIPAGDMPGAFATGDLTGMRALASRGWAPRSRSTIADGQPTKGSGDMFGVARSTVYRAVDRERLRAMVDVGSTVGSRACCPGGSSVLSENP